MKHNIEDIQLEEELILTLADSDIITKDDFNRTLGLNENEDILENVVMKDNDNRIVAEKRKKRATQAIYNSYDDEEFAEGAVVGRKRNLLSQYDEQNWTGEAVNEKPKFRIARNNTSNSTSKSINGGIMPSNEALKSGTLNAESITGDYFTIFDYANFKTNRKKVKKLRKARLKESHEATEEHKVDSSKNLIGCKNGMNILGPNMESKFSTMDGGVAEFADKSD